MADKSSKSEWKENTGNFWKAENEDDEITGLLVDIQNEVGVNKSTIYTIQEKESGEHVGVWGSTILDSRMKGISMGMEVRIVYKGLGDAKPGQNAPKLWQVFYKEPDA